MTISAGTRIGPFEVVTLLGAGGMGSVYRAHDSRLHRDVAIKVLQPAFAGDPDRLQRFEREALAVARLAHANILAIHDIGTHDGSPFLVTELLEGMTLRDKMNGRPQPVARVVDYGVQIARGLAAAHEHGIVHRDIKPENLFVTKDGRIKILDFGLAKLKDVEAATEASAVTLTRPDLGPLGTASYMAPEQARGGDRADHRADLFSLGVVLYEMLSGVSPFRRATGAETMTAILPAGFEPRRAALPGKRSRGAFSKRTRSGLRSRDAQYCASSSRPGAAPNVRPRAGAAHRGGASAAGRCRIRHRTPNGAAGAA
jgi:eukaryotic-like serine/threonine-protein kinase